MFDFWTVLYLLIVGLVAGYFARLVLTRTGDLSVWATLLVGAVLVLWAWRTYLERKGRPMPNDDRGH